MWSLRGNVCDDPDRLPAARAGRVDRRLAGLRPDRGLPLRRRSASAGRGCATSRSTSAPTAASQHVAAARRPRGSTARSACLNGSAGWGDVVVSAPVGPLPGVRRRVAAARVVGRRRPRWVDYAAASAADGPAPDRARPRGRSRRRTRSYLWDTGFHWGEWLEPGVELGDFGAFVGGRQVRGGHRLPAPLRARPLARIGELLGVDADDGRPLRRVADGARRAWQAEFVEPDGSLRVADPGRARARARLRPGRRTSCAPASPTGSCELVARGRRPPGTGFLLHRAAAARPSPRPVTSDTAYELLLQDTEPSWLTMIDRGATTVWERWNGVDADGVAHESLNHYSKGAVVSFLHRHVAGLQPTSPGYRTFRVRPQPGGGLTSATLRHDSPYGPIVRRLAARRRRVRARRAGPGRHHGRGACCPTAPPRRSARARTPGRRDGCGAVGSDRGRRARRERRTTLGAERAEHAGVLRRVGGLALVDRHGDPRARRRARSRPPRPA